ncbi:hypothetical protein MLD38_027413 [Melastoma candidum]|uniref:Uncharacterized protein n=1 Tax=Melastoma candidum TaxID=119954 RepID=A0ACB9P7J5_9MYRT|nr:hypothetical protein MLD38_027413 [Melastoma candidum]
MLDLMSRGVSGVDEEEENRSGVDKRKTRRHLPQKTAVEYERTSSSRRRLLAAGSGNLSLEWLYLLIGLTASLLVLPLVLPPLPPPPSLLLLLPICILGCLMILAFMPSSNPSTRDSIRL